MAERTMGKAAAEPMLREERKEHVPSGAEVPDGPTLGRVVPMTTSPASRSPNVLLVDDSGETRHALRALLEEQGITIVGEAADGAAAIALARQPKPDVVLMDIKMPGINGIEATFIISKSLPAPQVIVLSTFEEESLKRRARCDSVWSRMKSWSRA